MNPGALRAAQPLGCTVAGGGLTTTCNSGSPIDPAI
jgi:hypothetical protein